MKWKERKHTAIGEAPKTSFTCITSMLLYGKLIESVNVTTVMVEMNTVHRN